MALRAEDWSEWQADLEARVAACGDRQRQLQAGLSSRRDSQALLAQDLSRMADASEQDDTIQQLSQGYCRLRVSREDQALARQQELCQAHGHELDHLEAELLERERAALAGEQRGEDLATLRRSAGLERRRRMFLERQLAERSRVWPWLDEQQARLHEYRQLSAIYAEELGAASETVEALQAESSMLQLRAFEESSAAASAASRKGAQGATGGGGRAAAADAIPAFRPSSSGSGAGAPSSCGASSGGASLSEAGKLYAHALGESLGRASAPPALLRRMAAGPAGPAGPAAVAATSLRGAAGPACRGR